MIYLFSDKHHYIELNNNFEKKILKVLFFAIEYD